MTDCSECGEQLTSLIVCEACGVLATVPSGASPFEVFGVPAEYDLDVGALRKRLLKLTRFTHPDFHGTRGEAAVQLAEANTAHINEAFAVLSDNLTRADWLVRSLGGPTEQDERQMPQAFLMEVLEWNEILEEARSGDLQESERNRLESLGADLRETRDTSLQQIADQLTPLPQEGAANLTEVRRTLNALRYLDRALGELQEIG